MSLPSGIYRADIGDFILQTPLDIYQTSRYIFPESSIEIQLDESFWNIHLKTAPFEEPVVLFHPVSSTRFLMDLMELHFKKDAFEEPKRQLDPGRFSIEDMVLDDKHSYYQYKRQHQALKCHNVMKAYLENPRDLELFYELQGFGLNPEFVESCGDDESWLPFFQTIMEDKALDDPIFRNFRALYPSFTIKFANFLKTHEIAQLRTKDLYTHNLKMLETKVIGQKYALEHMAALMSSENHKENIVALFVGPTGVGKTELARACAHLRSFPITVFEMNQFSLKEHVATFFGAPSGFMSSTSLPQLVIGLKKSQNITQIDEENFVVRDLVLLFDEFEKAHTELQISLMTLFDEGHCTVRYTEVKPAGLGRPSETINRTLKYRLENCMILCTSNLFQKVICDGFRIKKPMEGIIEDFKEANLTGIHEKCLPPELLSRIPVVPFGPITDAENYIKLCKSKCDQFFNDYKIEAGLLKIGTSTEEPFYSYMKTKTHGDGTNIRAVNQFFNRLKVFVQKNKKDWGELKHVVIDFFISGDTHALKARISYHSEIAEDLLPMPGFESYEVES